MLIKRRGIAAAPPCEEAILLHAVFIGLDHLLDHLAADGTGLLRGQITVVTLLQVDADLPWCSFSILKKSVFSRACRVLTKNRGVGVFILIQQKMNANPIYAVRTLSVPGGQGNCFSGEASSSSPMKR